MNEQTQTGSENGGFSIGAKSFLISLGVIFALMVAAFVLAITVPGGQYARIVNEAGNTVIDTAGGFTSVQGGIPFWKWILSPFLVLGAQGNSLLIAIIAFLLVIGGAFTALDRCGLLKYMLLTIANKFGASRYKLMAVVTFFFMAMGSLAGSFEECVPLVPIVVSLAVALGWDAVTGFAMCLLSAGCGFAAGVMNPFSVGVAQKLAGLPMFSGVWYRAVAFVLIYALLFFVIYRHAKKVERPVADYETEYVYDAKKSRALGAFAGILCVGLLVVISSTFLTFLQDYTMIIIAVMFLVAGVVSTLLTGETVPGLCKAFGKGVLGMLPAILMILMASSIKFILEEAKVLDTILHAAIEKAGTLPGWAVILFVYLLVLVMNFFVASGSAKAFMIVPLIVPLAGVFNIPAQLCVMAYAFGDGFSNVFYPTNAALLLGLNLCGIGYGTWVKWSWKFQLCNLILTSGLLLLGLAIGYC